MSQRTRSRVCLILLLLCCGLVVGFIAGPSQTIKNRLHDIKSVTLTHLMHGVDVGQVEAMHTLLIQHPTQTEVVRPAQHSSAQKTARIEVMKLLLSMHDEGLLTLNPQNIQFYKECIATAHE